MDTLLSVEHEVRSYLEKVPTTRDDDRYLLYLMWSKQSKTGTFLEDLKDGKVTHPETIRRTRQKLQEKNEDLRGKSWESRHGYQSEIHRQLNFLDRLGL